MFSRARVWVCLALILGATGCTAPLDLTKTATLDPGDKYQVTYDLDGQPKEQTLKVEVTAASTEVNVYIVLADKQAEYDRAKFEDRAKFAAASELNTKKATISAKMPPKTDARVYVQLAGTMRTDVTVRLTNR